MQAPEQVVTSLLKFHDYGEIKNRIFEGDAYDTLRHFPSNSIDCVVTSPPYYLTRDYKIVSQIGRESSIELYIANLIKVFSQVKRILKPTGNCWINIGDKVDKKDFLLVPEQFAIAMKGLGWILADKVIWHKPNVLPGTTKKRFTINHEFIYRFIKSDKLFYWKAQYGKLADVTMKEIQRVYDKNSIKEYKANNVPDPSDAKRSIIKSLNLNTGIIFGGKKANGYENGTYSGEGWKPATVVLSARDKRIAKKMGWNEEEMDYAEWYFGHREKKSFHDHNADNEKGMEQRGQGKQPLAYPYGSLERAVWKISHASFKKNHYAVFPEQLVQKCIASGCPPVLTHEESGELRKGIVLDPFIGSGTVAIVAIKNGLDFVGIDLSPEYCKITSDRITEEYARIGKRTIKKYLDGIKE